MMFLPLLLGAVVLAAVLATRHPRWVLCLAVLVVAVATAMMTVAVLTGNFLLAYLSGLANIVGLVLVLVLMRDATLEWVRWRSEHVG